MLVSVKCWFKISLRSCCQHRQLFIYHLAMHTHPRANYPTPASGRASVDDKQAYS